MPRHSKRASFRAAEARQVSGRNVAVVMPLVVAVAGEGADAGDKAPYKAMTGALKYALLQSFLLSTGDDPEDERTNSRAALGSERVITPEQVRELQGLIEETGTELERVPAFRWSRCAWCTTSWNGCVHRSTA